MNTPKLLTREEFRNAVFARADHKCVFCGEPAADAHHILERRLWPDGGYYAENGAAVCPAHHLDCERTRYSVEDVRNAAGIKRIVVPPHLYDDHIYDKWGNPVLGDGRRGKGELFQDESVRKALKEGGVLDLSTDYVKYGRTFHLPWSAGINDDDKALKDCSQFEGRHCIWTKKMDGENTTGYSNGHIHARSIDSRGGEDRAWVKQFLSERLFDMPEGWRICGENLWAEHSIHYDDLKSYFYAFSMWDDQNMCLGWYEMTTWFDLLGITAVPILHEGIWSEKVCHDIEKDLDPSKDEGYVVRLSDPLPFSAFKKSIAKYVRAGHVQTTKHWRAGRAFVPNGLGNADA